jgi:hypothetical protein
MDSPSIETANGYFCTFRINDLVVQAFVPPDRNPPRLSFDRADKQFVRRVWPSPRMTVSWPPPKLVAESNLEAFADAFLPDRQ